MTMYKVLEKGKIIGKFETEDAAEKFIDKLPSGSVYRIEEYEEEYIGLETLKVSEKEIRKVIKTDFFATGQKLIPQEYTRKHKERYSKYGKNAGFKKPTPYKKQKNEKNMYALYLN